MKPLSQTRFANTFVPPRMAPVASGALILGAATGTSSRHTPATLVPELRGATTASVLTSHARLAAAAELVAVFQGERLSNSAKWTSHRLKRPKRYSARSRRSTPDRSGDSTLTVGSSLLPQMETGF
jgi:hypothetical protein